MKPRHALPLCALATLLVSLAAPSFARNVPLAGCSGVQLCATTEKSGSMPMGPMVDRRGPDRPWYNTGIVPPHDHHERWTPRDRDDRWMPDRLRRVPLSTGTPF